MLLNITNKALGVLVWGPIVFLSLLLAINTLGYFEFNFTEGFLAEKTEAMKDDVWVVSFYIHIVFGIPCLFLPIVQFSKYILRKRKSLHLKIGKLYVSSTLFLVAPTGMYMSFYAKEGFWSMLGFFVTGLCMSVFTWLGVTYMRRGDLKLHVDWMTRSYAVATSALTFRILHILFHRLEVDYHFNYLMSLWMSLILNLLIAEIALFFLHKKFKLSNQTIKS